MNQDNFYIGLDVGTTSVKVIVAEKANQQLNVIGIGSAPSRGLDRGVIVDIDQVVLAITQAIKQAEEKSGIQINHVITGIPANLLQIEKCQGMNAVGEQSREIDDEQVQAVVQSALTRSLPPEREILAVLPIDFTVDGFDGIKDPRGMLGVRLEMNGILFTAPKTIIHNIKSCIQKAGLTIDQLVVTPLALGKLLLNDGQQDFGGIVIDVGGGQTTAAVIHDHQLKYSVIDPEGGDNINKDISIVLNTSLDDAKKLKNDFGSTDSLTVSEDLSIPVRVVGKQTPEKISEKQLSEIIEARVVQIFENLKRSLDKAGALELPGGIVLTGGVTSLPGIKQVAQDVLQQPVHLYQPDQMGIRHPAFSHAWALVSYTANQSDIALLAQSVVATPHHQPAQVNQTAGQQKTKQTKVNKDKKQGKATDNLKKFFESLFG